MPAILNRTELRAYDCPGQTQPAFFDIAPHQALTPTGCTVRFAMGAGPALLPTLTHAQEGFTATNAQGVRTRDPIGIDTPNARTAVALLPNGSLLVVFAAQSVNKPGLTLPQLAQWLATQHVVKAMALDGGSSTSLYLNGKAYWGKGKRNQGQWQPVQRPVKAILIMPGPAQ
jgi:hypothetical protein